MNNHYIIGFHDSIAKRELACIIGKLNGSCIISQSPPPEKKQTKHIHIRYMWDNAH